MKIFVLTQPDAFYIPPLLQRFFDLLPDDCRVEGAAALEGEISAGNAVKYLRFMGPKAFVVQSLHYVKHRILDLVDRVYELDRPHSVEAAFRRQWVPVHTPSSLASEHFHERLRSEGIDLIISIACPAIIPQQVLDIPTHGCINLHGAPLPKYRGLLPSFWVLANGEEETAITVHVMNDKLDDGPIVVQKRVPIEPYDTLHSLVYRSKVRYGAEALAEAVRRIRDDEVELQENPESEATYYSFPTREAGEEFRRRGRRFR